MVDTPNHAYNAPDPGTEDWHGPLNENFERFDVDIELRDSGDPDSNGYAAAAGAKYLDTDTGIIYLADGSSWTETFRLDDGDRFIEELRGGAGISPFIINNSDTLSVNWSNAAELDASGAVTTSYIEGLSGGDGLDPGTISDGDTLSVSWGDAADIDASGSISPASSLDLAGNDLTDDGTTIWNATAGQIEQGVLANDAVTITPGPDLSGGGTVALGDATSINLEIPYDHGEGFNDAFGFGSTVAGGEANIADMDYSTIGGGFFNESFGRATTIGGGESNIADDDFATVGGGVFNIAGNTSATVGGGESNSAFGDSATVPGGRSNIADGNASFAAGRNAHVNGHDGAFVWGASTGADASAAGQVVFQATGGMYVGDDGGPSGDFYTDDNYLIDTSTGAHLTIGGIWTDSSSASVKEDVVPVNPESVLEGVKTLPLTEWSYETEPGDVRHLGPMAEDFHAAFGLGADEEHIASLDTAGVAMAAIQGLVDRLEAKDDHIADLEAEVEGLKDRLADVEDHLEAMADV